ncbi:MAG: hypothetical protein LBR80_16990, partial [Deltaproteobacteria bacterium]|nr:hypothetical protein [Deltaproteobacteria bacterium]
PGSGSAPDQKKPVGYFVLHNGEWLFINQTLQELVDLDARRHCPPGEAVRLFNGQRLQLSRERQALVSILPFEAPGAGVPQ